MRAVHMLSATMVATTAPHGRLNAPAAVLSAMPVIG